MVPTSFKALRTLGAGYKITPAPGRLDDAIKVFQALKEPCGRGNACIDASGEITWVQPGTLDPYSSGDPYIGSSKAHVVLPMRGPYPLGPVY